MPLTETETIAFREEIRNIDTDIQNFFRIYYITGIAAVVAWVVGPNSRSLIELVLGNRGYNIFALLILAFLNAVALSFLLYRSIEIHELAQFLVSSSTPTAGAVKWELWRNSTQSATRIGRRIQAPLLAVVPILVSLTILVSTLVILKDVREGQGATASIVGAPAQRTTQPLTQVRRGRIVRDPDTMLALDSMKLKEEQIKPSKRTITLAWIALGFVTLVHVIPSVLIYENLIHVKRLWSEVWDDVWSVHKG